MPSWLIAGASKSTSASSKSVAARHRVAVSIDDEREAGRRAARAMRSDGDHGCAPSGVSATWSWSIVRRGAAVRSRGRGSVAGYGVPASSTAAASPAACRPSRVVGSRASVSAAPLPRPPRRSCPRARPGRSRAGAARPDRGRGPRTARGSASCRIADTFLSLRSLRAASPRPRACRRRGAVPRRGHPIARPRRSRRSARHRRRAGSPGAPRRRAAGSSHSWPDSSSASRVGIRSGRHEQDVAARR